MPTVRMICFANSKKLGGRCIAGLAWDGREYKNWIRPISSYGKGELNWERWYEDGSDPELLDIIELDALAPKPSGCHVEDVLINPRKKWKRLGRISHDAAARYISSRRPPLWLDGKHTNYGFNDKIDAMDAESLRTSLQLVGPDELTMTATSEGWEGKRKVRGEFDLGSASYTFAVTDPKIESEFADEDIGWSRLVAKPILCISISEVFEKQNACYKLIAGVMEAE